MEWQKLDYETEPELWRAVRAANEATWTICGQRDTCIATSHALHAYLREKGRETVLTRIETAIFLASKRSAGVVLGMIYPEGRKAAGENMWHGHMGVVVDDAWLLDATLDQANVVGVPHGVVVPIALDWHELWKATYIQEGDVQMRFSYYPRQVGWKSAGDTRPSHWRNILEEMHCL